MSTLYLFPPLLLSRVVVSWLETLLGRRGRMRRVLGSLICGLPVDPEVVVCDTLSFET